MRAASGVLLSSLLLAAAFLMPGPAAAGDYGYSERYDNGGYRDNYSRNDRYYRSDRYYRNDRYRRNSWSSERYNDRPHRYYGHDYASSTGYSDQPTRYSDQPRRFYSENCYPRQFKLYDDAGGWVWGTRTVCN